MPPVARLPLAVRNSHDEDVVRFDGVEHSVGKYMHHTSANIALDDAPSLWRGDDTVYRAPSFTSEAPAQSASAHLVEQHRFGKLFLRLGMELDPHCVKVGKTCGFANVSIGSASCWRLCWR